MTADPFSKTFQTYNTPVLVISGLYFAQNRPEKRGLRDFKKNLPENRVRGKHILLKIVKRTVFNQFFELDDEQNGFRKGGKCSTQQIHLKD